MSSRSRPSSRLRISRSPTRAATTAKAPGTAPDRGRPSRAYAMAHKRPATAPEAVTRRNNPDASRSSSRAPGLAANSDARRAHCEAVASILAMLLGRGSWLSAGVCLVHADRDDRRPGRGDAGHHPDRGDQPEEVGDSPR